MGTKTAYVVSAVLILAGLAGLFFFFYFGWRIALVGFLVLATWGAYESSCRRASPRKLPRRYIAYRMK